MVAQAGLFVARDAGGNGTTPKGARTALAGLLAKNADGTVKVGALVDGVGAVVTGAAGMTYNVRKFVAVTKATEANGPVLVPNDGVVSVSTDPAPGSNSRIDVIYLLQRLVTGDGGSDSTVAPLIDVAKGATSATPVAPAIPTGALELARVTVPSGTTATSGLTFTQGPWTTTGHVASNFTTTLPTVGGQAAGPDGQPLLMRFGFHSEATSSVGTIAKTFAPAFPNGVLHASATTVSGTGVAPAVNSGLLSKTGVTFIWPGVVSTTISFSYVAWGW